MASAHGHAPRLAAGNISDDFVCTGASRLVCDARRGAPVLWGLLVVWELVWDLVCARCVRLTRMCAQAPDAKRGRAARRRAPRVCHKQDLPNAMNAADITDKLGLHSLRQRNWYIQATCATSGEGLYEGLDWLSGQLAKKG